MSTQINQLKKYIILPIAICLFVISNLSSQCTTIPDNGYDGTIASMTCLTYTDASNVIITDVNVEASINHTWVGDLVIKVVSPSNTISTLMSRPGFAEMADDGDGCCGDSSNATDTSPFTYDDTAASGVSAEDMGNTILGGDVVCQDDAICDYIPFPDTGPGVSLADFNGELSTGSWMVCFGDAVALDAGEVCGINLTIAGTPAGVIPTMGQWGLIILFLSLTIIGSLALYSRRRLSMN